MDPAVLAQQVTDILVPALPFIHTRGRAVADKGKEVMEMLFEKTNEKTGSKVGINAKALLNKISPKMSGSLEKALIKVSENSDDPKAKEEAQQEILKLLIESPDFAREIEPIANLNVENIDQLETGNYNNFFNFGSPSSYEYIKIIEYLDQKRKENTSQEILSNYSPSMLPYYPERLKQFVTEYRTEELVKFLTYIENHRILLISGVAGIGKTTIARALVDLRPLNVPEPFWFNFNQNKDAKLGDILERLALYLNAPEIVAFESEKREPGQSDVDKLIDKLQKRSQVWLIFDDLSTILEDQYFADKGIELLFSSLRYGTHNAKILITSRIVPILENGESLIDVTEGEERQHLKGLTTDFEIDYLSRNGLDQLKPEKLKELAQSVDGNPLALKLLVELVKEFGVEDILKDLSIYSEEKENTILKARKLFYKLSGNEKELLERISVYREPVNMKCLKEMFTENTPKNAVKKLIDKSLLETDYNGNYWLHPLVQEFAYNDLENKKAVHIIAVKYYLSLPLPEKPSEKKDVQSLIEAYYHAYMGGEYDLAADIILRSNLDYFLGLWGDSRTLIEIYEKLLHTDHLENGIYLKDKHIFGAILGSLGLAYSNLGKPKIAIDYYKQALEISRKIGDRHSEGNNLGNLGLTYNILGEPRKAIECYEQALKISRCMGDKYGEGADLGNLGLAYSNLGELTKAIKCYQQALNISIEIGDKRGEGNRLGNLGNIYSELGENTKAIKCYQQALNISIEIGDRLGEGNHLRNLGLAYSNLGETRKAIEYYEKALKISIEICDNRGSENSLGNLGLAYSHLGEPRKAIEYYERALKISIEIGDKRGEGTDLGNLGNVYGELGDYKKAIIFLRKSLAIGKEIEDPRIIHFCEQKLNEFKRLELDL
jgi:tetratricopeptide (TPR) repeat protein